MILRLPVLSLGVAAVLTGCGTCGFPNEDLGKIKPGMTTEQVVALLGQPNSIDQSQTEDQTIQGEVYHYAAPTGEARVTFVNHTVFKSEFVPGAKS